ncbi:HET-domain-containing protein, partial [Trametes versicolor FP-101664 SS1]|uniref:HET-domain-containing protein n=1 Tax=Trametes versicolor (strain FP-101664) TaxID=717944 RepID=UPI0004624354
MRLLDTTTLELHEFPDATRCPPYAILSHVWMSGSESTLQCCAFASANGYRYIWVDTCCIDKTSSAELSEAINSMGEWYAKADVCYVYLHDVDAQENPRRLGSRFRRCKWFTRGWTLQELLFPDRVVFLSSDWQTSLGTKTSLCQEIEETTGIASDVLTGRRDMQSVCVAVRMSWASRRETTRLEDEAYCLLG